jgi:hypothetical protein
MAQPLGNLPIDAKVKMGSIYGNAIQWKIKGKNHPGYPSGAITVVSDRIIKIMASDAKEPNNGDSNRKNYGSNRYIYSNLRQWLNKKGSPWYEAQPGADGPPASGAVTYNPYENIPAFLTGFTDQEIAAILTTTLMVNRASFDGSGQETFTDKIFNLSEKEVGLTTDTAEGSTLEGFTDNASRIAYPTTDAVANSDYTSSSLNANIAWYYWLRTPYASDSYNVRNVVTNGTLTNRYAYNGNIGLRPACNLDSSNLVSDTPDADGCYTLIFNEPPTTPGFINVPEQIVIGGSPQISWGASTDPEGTAVGYILERKFNSGDFEEVYDGSAISYTDNPIPAGNTSVQYRVKAYDEDGMESSYAVSASRTIITNAPPTITGTDTDLGTFSMQKPGGYNYTVDDMNGHAVTVVETIDDVVLRTYQPTLGQQQTLQFSDAAWIKVLNGTHTLKITAQDVQAGQAVRTLTFTRNVDIIEFYAPIMPFPADGMPTQALVQVTGSMPQGCVLTVEICNNGNDDDPTWEDCTDAVINNMKYSFTNQEKSAIAWGVKLHIILQRGSAQGAVYITSIGGNFR